MLCTVSLICTLFAGCGQGGDSGPPAQNGQTEAADSVQTDSGVSDQEAADHVAELIDAIYVQKRSDNIDAQCEEAKAAWDVLTDIRKENLA